MIKFERCHYPHVQSQLLSQAEASSRKALAAVNSRKWRKSSRLSEDRIAELRTAKTERNKYKTTQKILNCLLNIHF